MVVVGNLDINYLLGYFELYLMLDMVNLDVNLEGYF
jgi:hypothetical protein